MKQDRNLTPEQKRKQRRRRQWVKALTNPHMLISVAIAWFFTNGWAYCAAGIGTFCHIPWLRNTGLIYLGILWAPGTPEKVLTFGLAMMIMRVLFPQDRRTVLLLRRKLRLLIYVTKMQFRSVCSRLRRKKIETISAGAASGQEQREKDCA